MDRSETIKELAAALSQAQAKMEGAAKDKINPHFRSKYADLGNVVDALKEPLAANGLSYVQIIHDEPNAARVETLIMHSSGEFLSCGCVSIPVSKNDAHGFGSALTYARRYSLSAAFGVAPEDDDGNKAVDSKQGEEFDKGIQEKKNLQDAEFAKARAASLSSDISAKIGKITNVVHVRSYEAVLKGTADTDTGKAHEHFGAWDKLSGPERVDIQRLLDAKKSGGK